MEPLAIDRDVESVKWLGERVRRIALGLAAALITARAFWPGEPDLKFEAGTGLYWDLAVLITAGIAIAATLIGGAFRLRFSWADLAVAMLFILVGLSSTQALDRRPAINLAWDWGAVGILYFLIRHLPRTRGESNSLVAILVATGVAVSFYGLYQNGVELPQTRAHYRANKAEALRFLGITPGSSAQMLFEKRLNESSEPISTFALANSLAGFLITPLIVILSVGWENLVRRDPTKPRGSPIPALALALLPTMLIAVCVLLTKSRSAWIGLAVALAILAFRERHRVRRRTLAIAGAAGVGVLVLLIAVGLATKQLDRLVVTEATKSLRVRLEYWEGAWGAITENKNVFWKGYGPANFTAAYLKHKLPQASEEVFDPHNMIFEVWATAGTPAMLALLAALALAFRDLFGSPVDTSSVRDLDEILPAKQDPGAPPVRSHWIVACGALGLVVAMFVGKLNPFEGDLFTRILVLGFGWGLAVLFGIHLWRRLPVAPIALAASALAISINLLAAGGIGISSVALMLWGTIALGLNLRDDRWCGLLRIRGGRLFAFGLALGLSALIGSFYGAITPFWRSEAAIAEGLDALNGRPPKFEKAEAAYLRAQTADHYSANPWLGYALEKMAEWEARGAKVDDKRWKTIPVILADAVTPPRNPNAWSLHQYRASVIRTLIARIGSQMKPVELIMYRGHVVKSTREASRLYPTNASLHAELAQASAEIGMYGDAVSEAKEALRLHKLTPHADKKLPAATRGYLEDELPKWEKLAPGSVPSRVMPRP